MLGRSTLIKDMPNVYPRHVDEEDRAREVTLVGILI